MEKQKNSKSNSFYEMRIALLERELAEKTRILENTSSNLADSQKQYQNLLKQFETIKNEAGYKYDLKQDKTKFDSDFIFTAMKSRAKNSYLGRPLQQLQDFEETVKQLSYQMDRLKSQNMYFQNELKQWNNFSISIFNQIKGILHFDQDFPVNDSEAQRFILNDMFQKISFNFNHQKEEENRQYYKYKQAKAKLCEVQKKCDRMLELLDEKGVDIQLSKYDKRRRNPTSSNCYLQANQNYNINKRTTNENLDMNSIRDHIDQLSTITKQMKEHYNTIYKIEE